jgi:hypothetical protein
VVYAQFSERWSFCVVDFWADVVGVVVQAASVVQLPLVQTLRFVRV